MISTSGPRGGRPLVEATLALRVADLRGPLGFYATRNLTAADGTTIRLRIEVGGRHGWVFVEHWPARARWAASSYSVALEATPQRLGGVRWWLRCPTSGVRTPVLYLPAGARRLASRQAHGLGFASQRQRAPARAASRADRLRSDLGGGTDPARPRGMWRSTFARRVALLARLEGMA